LSCNGLEDIASGWTPREHPKEALPVLFQQTAHRGDEYAPMVPPYTLDVYVRLNFLLSMSTRGPNAHSNKVRFQVHVKDGRVLKGTVVVNAVAFDEQMTAYLVIEVDELEGAT